MQKAPTTKLASRLWWGIELPLVHRPNTRLRSPKFPEFKLSQTLPHGQVLPEWRATRKKSCYCTKRTSSVLALA